MPSMSNAPTAAPAPIHPDPHRAVCARLDSAGAGNILRLLLRTLFAYGRNLVETLRQSDCPQVLPWYPFLTTIFRTTNPAPITVIVIRGLLRLTALQHRFSNSLARARDSLPLRDDRPAKRIDGGTRPARGQPHARPIAAILRDICLDLGIVSALTDPATRPLSSPARGISKTPPIPPPWPPWTKPLPPLAPCLHSPRRSHPHVSPMAGAP